MSALSSTLRGVPAHIGSDDLATAVRLMVEGRVRREQRQLVASARTICSRAISCQPAAGWEKGGVEASVGFSRRNFLVPIPAVASFGAEPEPIARLFKDDQRRVARASGDDGEGVWERERPVLRSLPVCLRVV